MSDENDIFGEDDVELPNDEAQAEPVAEEPEQVEGTASVEPSTEIEEPQKVVPMNALNEARMNERQAKQELHQMKQQMDQLQGMRGELDEWRKSQQTQTQQNDEERFNSDPLGALRDDIRETREMIQNKDQATQQHDAQQQEAQRVVTQAGSLAKEFAESTPDYGDAFEHYMNTRKQELSVYGLSDQEIANTMDNEAYALSANALAQGRNPAEIIYGIAKTRGYSTKNAPIASDEPTPKIENIEKG